MEKAILQTSHEDLFLDQGNFLSLGFIEGWVCFRVTHREWSSLEPWSLGAIAALSNLAAWNEVQDANARHYLEPHDETLIYHSFWGVTPTRARIYAQYPPRADLGSSLATPRTITGDIGYIDGEKSPFYGPFSPKTEIISVHDKFPAFQAYNPLNDVMYNVMLNIDQWHYRYQIIKDRNVIKDLLVGTRRVKKYTMGQAWPNATTIPNWLEDRVTPELLKYSLDLMAEGG